MIDRVPVITVTQADILCAFLSYPPLGYILCVCFCCFPPSLEQRRELLKSCFDLLFSLCKPVSSPSWYLFTEDLAKLKDRCVFQKIRTPCFSLFRCFPWLQCWKSGPWPLSLISLSLVLFLPRSDFLVMTWNSPLCSFEFLFTFGHTMQRRDQPRKEGTSSRTTQWRSGDDWPKQKLCSFFWHRKKGKRESDRKYLKAKPVSIYELDSPE